MKLKNKLSIVFTIVQVSAALIIGLSLSTLSKNVIKEMIEKESREMVASIAESIEIMSKLKDVSDISSPAFKAAREYVINRTIGDTGFYFILDADGKYIIHSKESVEGQNWVGKHDFIDYIMANSHSEESKRFIRYISPKTGAWKQVYFTQIPGLQWIVCSSAWEQEMYAPLAKINMVLIIILVFSSSIILFISLRVSHILGKTLSDMARALSYVAKGDLTVSIEENSYSTETKEATVSLNKSVVKIMNTMIDNVKTTALRSFDIGKRLKKNIEHSVLEIESVEKTLQNLDKKMDLLDNMTAKSTKSTDTLNQTAEKLDSQSRNLSTAAEESSAAIVEINATMTNLRSVAERQSENGSELIHELGIYRKTLAEVMKSVKGIESRVEDIASFNAMINNIADQTHLLAMNAAIEAARAGQHGKGFAVVSSEIRELAESTGSNAVQVGDAINLISKNIQQTSDAGESLKNHFNSLESKTKSFIDAFSQISGGTKELEIGADEVAKSADLVYGESRSLVDSVSMMKEAVHDVRDMMSETHSFVQNSHTAFQEITDRAAVVVNAQREIAVLTKWNNRNTRSLTDQTSQFKTEHKDDVYSLTSALTDHEKWLDKIMSLCDHKEKNMEIGRDLLDADQCRFGQWINETSKDEKYAAKESFKELTRIHIKLHKEFKALIDIALARDECLNREELRPIQIISRELVEKLEIVDEEYTIAPTIAYSE